MELEEQDKTECSSLALRLDFTKDDVTRVIEAISVRYIVISELTTIKNYYLHHALTFK